MSMKTKVVDLLFCSHEMYDKKIFLKTMFVRRACSSDKHCFQKIFFIVQWLAIDKRTQSVHSVFISKLHFILFKNVFLKQL